MAWIVVLVVLAVVGDDVFNQVRGGLRHAPRTARRAESTALATEGQQPVMATLPAAQPQEAMRQDAALEEGVELVLDEPRQLRSGAGLGVRDEAGGVLLDQAIQRGLLGAVALVMERGTIGQPPMLVCRGPGCCRMHARPAREVAPTVSAFEPLRHRPSGWGLAK